ncbi:amino acid ABC transporter permease [Streptomyces himalayensis]|uniref:Amino acid ABC transporter permease n=1 Tax=Streptomyces himalayensis subsp. himalayensis TaxID=2756131 RepID=A0A7W0ID42_9ACTN|nr:amino acid ABC transporter permease [Streptomyces himalayensis]MBA2951303.1 amino acid ABC transporter permease [Streptomyces himalayensis subsp. himalayensis]
MSSSVLYDAPGPKARVRNIVFTVVGSAAVLGLIVFAIYRLNVKGVLEPEVWNIFNNAGVRANIRDGVLSTLKVFALAGVLSLVLGLLLAVARLSDHKPVSLLATGFIELFRAVPLLITIYALWVVFLSYKDDLGVVGENTAFWALVIGLTVYNGCVQAEVLRAGINAVPRGQVEAAYALGLRKTQVMTMLLVPQAVRSMLPTMISQLVVTLKDTSLGYIITYAELLYAARTMANNIIVNGENPITAVVIVVGAIYIALCLALSSLATWIEKRGRRAKTGIAVAAAAEPAEAPGVLDASEGPLGPVAAAPEAPGVPVAPADEVAGSAAGGQADPRDGDESDGPDAPGGPGGPDLGKK